MKTLVKIALPVLLLLLSAPSFAQLRWGFYFGTPPPPRREVIIERPYPDAIWAPGYYSPFGRRYIWVPGRWNRPHFHEGWREERFEHRRWERDRRGFDGDHDDRRGKENFDHRQGRIR